MNVIMNPNNRKLIHSIVLVFFPFCFCVSIAFCSEHSIPFRCRVDKYIEQLKCQLQYTSQLFFMEYRYIYDNFM